MNELLSEGHNSSAVQKVHDLRRKDPGGEWRDGEKAGANEGEGAMKVVNQRGKQGGV